MSKFPVLIHDTQASPKYRANIGPYIEGLKLSTICPGGCATCTFRLRVSPKGQVAIPSFFGENFKFTVLDNGVPFWIGRGEDFNFRNSSSGRWWDVTAKGYGVNLGDDVFGSSSAGSYNARNKLTTTIVSDAVTTLAPQIDVVTITGTGFTFANSADISLDGLTAALVVFLVSKFGDSSFNPQVWSVYPRKTDGSVEFKYGPRPVVAGVQGYLQDFEEADFGLTGRQLGNRAIVKNTSGVIQAEANDTSLQGAGPVGWNLIKSVSTVMPLITDNADFIQAANVLLTYAKVLRMSAKSLKVKRTAVFTDTNNARVPLHLVQAGQLFQFRDISPAEGPLTNLAWSNSFLIAGTEYDEDSQTLSIQPENYDTLIERSLAQVRALLQGRVTL